jgi:hypothetical protein
MYGKAHWFSLILVFVIAIWMGVILGYFVAAEIFDPRFFTYFNYALGFAFYNVLYVSFFSVELFEFVTLFIVPIYLNTTTFVCIAIVIIVELNDTVFTRAGVLGGTNRTIGETHTGDWIVHYVPFFSILAVLGSIQVYYLDFVRNYWKYASRNARIFYIFYAFLTPLVVLLIYMLTMPFAQNYPTTLTTWELFLMVIGLSLVIQAIFLTFVLTFPRGKLIVIQNTIETPAGVQEKKLK